MKRLQAFKYELRPDGEQAHRMRRFAGACRFVFNKALALQKERCEGGETPAQHARRRILTPHPPDRYCQTSRVPGSRPLPVNIARKKDIKSKIQSFALEKSDPFWILK